MDVPINVGNWRIRYYSKANWHITFTFTYQNDSKFHDKSQIQNFNINSVSRSWTKNFLFGTEQSICQTNLEGGWSGFGMVRSWDGSQLIGMNPNISSFYPKLIPTERCSTILPPLLSSSPVCTLCSICCRIISDKSQKASFRPERKQRGRVEEEDINSTKAKDCKSGLGIETAPQEKLFLHRHEGITAHSAQCTATKPEWNFVYRKLVFMQNTTDLS